MKSIGFLIFLLIFSVSAVGQDVEMLRAELDSLARLESRLEIQLEQLRAQKNAIQLRLRSSAVSAVDRGSVYLQTNMDASLRSEPRPAARVLQVVSKESSVLAVDYDGAFWKVRHRGVEGWIMRPFLDESEEAVQMREVIEASGRLTSDAGTNRTSGIQAKDRYGKPLLITAFGIHPPNSAGGVGIYYAFEHLDSTRAIRDISFTFTPYNRSGEIERDSNSGVATKRVRRYGPISVFDGERAYETENFWYNQEIDCMEIDQVYIRYSDGTHRRWKEVEALLPSGIKNDCRPEAGSRLE